MISYQDKWHDQIEHAINDSCDYVTGEENAKNNNRFFSYS